MATAEITNAPESDAPAFQAPGLPSPDLSREEEARSLRMRFLYLEPPTSLRVKGLKLEIWRREGRLGRPQQKLSPGRTPKG